MRPAMITVSLLALAAFGGASDTRAAPEPAAPAAPIAAPQDKPYLGVIRLTVDATDTVRRIFRVHETIPVAGGEDLVLLYPQWLPGTHGPVGKVDRLAGLVITANGATIAWARDPVDVYAFHLRTPKDAVTLDIDFQYLSPVNAQAGGIEVTAELLTLEWPSVVLYPAGYFARQIAVEAGVTLPGGWQFATALEQAPTGGATTFRRVSLETLADSPVYAGRYVARQDLDPSDAVPVRLNAFADRPELLEIKPPQLEAHKALIRQAYKLFGSRHYDHYDFLVTLSDHVGYKGLEHHRSSQDHTSATYFSDWDKTITVRDLLPHEFTHSWNGKFRRPADLWTPNFNVPMRDSLLWVYEGQTQYWGKVLTARSGLWSQQQALDALALIAANFQARAGRTWRPLQDTADEAIIGARARSQSWTSWQRSADYYDEGLLIWLDADTLIRDLSHGERSLDDFARRFFGINDGSYVPVTYTFDDVVTTLNDVQPYEWAAFLRSRIDVVNPRPPLDGITRGGYKLVFDDVASEFYKSIETRAKNTNLTYSLGLSVEGGGNIVNVLWDGPAFKAGLSPGVQILAVNDIAFNADRLKDVVKAAKTGNAPIELIVKDQDRFRVVRIDYHDGLRYPHLARDPAQPARLDEILAAKK
ncbi:MAG: M61 family metallopeptidase [Xanthobacteraceae bacterium]